MQYFKVLLWSLWCCHMRLWSPAWVLAPWPFINPSWIMKAFFTMYISHLHDASAQMWEHLRPFRKLFPIVSKRHSYCQAGIETTWLFILAIIWDPCRAQENFSPGTKHHSMQRLYEIFLKYVLSQGAVSVSETNQPDLNNTVCPFLPFLWTTLKWNQSNKPSTYKTTENENSVFPLCFTPSNRSFISYSTL